MSADRLAARLLATFLGELEEQVRVMNADLLALETDPTNTARLKSLFRVAHTLKGAARAASVPAVESACHTLETLLAQARDGLLTLGPEQFSLLFTAADALGDAGRRIRAGQELAGSSLSRLLETLEAATPAQSGRPARGQPPEPPGPASVPSAPPRGAEQSERQLRVEADKLDAVLASVEQLLMVASRAGARPGEMQALTEHATQWAAQWRRAGQRLRLAIAGTDAPASVTSSLLLVEENLRRFVQDTNRLLVAHSRDARALSQVSDEIADRVRRLRMRPFADACEALPRVVRDLAAAGGRDVRLQVVGGQVEADRAVLDGLREAILHLVRNAVDHGTDAPETRAAAGKPPHVTVTVAAALNRDRIIVTVADDGRGLDLSAIRARAERLGRAGSTDDRGLVRALFDGGISTRLHPTAISGRGVGLDLVRDAVERIRGSVEVTWTEGRGTTFTLECPLTLVSLRALLVIVGSQFAALPTANVERLLRVRPDEIRRAEGRDVIGTSGGVVPVVSLARLLGPPLQERPIAGPVPVVMLHAQERRLAGVVDELVAEQDLVVRALDGGRRAAPHVSGAAMLGTGRVALVLNAAAVVASGLGATGPSSVGAASETDGRGRLRILVVDDSITTRTLEQSVLEAAGYVVRTAVDGADAWRLMQEQHIDLVVADVEMPRMDGFALCAAIRGSKRVGSIPVVLVTALESPEHRARGFEAGADAYLSKSSFDQEALLETIRQLLG